MGENQDGAINIPCKLEERIERRLPRTEFNNTGEYVTFVLEEILYEVEEGDDEEKNNKVREEDVKDRLKSLGYLEE